MPLWAQHADLRIPTAVVKPSVQIYVAGCGSAPCSLASTLGIFYICIGYLDIVIPSASDIGLFTHRTAFTGRRYTSNGRRVGGQQASYLTRKFLPPCGWLYCDRGDFPGSRCLAHHCYCAECSIAQRELHQTAGLPDSRA